MGVVRTRQLAGLDALDLDVERMALEGVGLSPIAAERFGDLLTRAGELA